MRSMREELRIFTYLSALFIVCLIFASAGIAQETGVDARHGSGHGHDDNKVDFWLTILHNNDGESQLINAGVGLEDFGGVARFATLVKKLRKTGDKGLIHKRIVLTLNSGDNFLAGPEFNASQQKGGPLLRLYSAKQDRLRRDGAREPRVRLRPGHARGFHYRV